MFEDLDELRPRTGGMTQCKMDRFLETLDSKDREILEDALADTVKWTTNGLHSALVKKGIDVGYQTIYRHRRNVCVCRLKNA